MTAGQLFQILLADLHHLEARTGEQFGEWIGERKKREFGMLGGLGRLGRLEFRGWGSRFFPSRDRWSFLSRCCGFFWGRCRRVFFGVYIRISRLIAGTGTR